MLMTPPGTNHRRSERMRSFMAARILYNKGMMKVDCTIRNTSDGGAKLEVSGSVTLPEHFELHIPQRNVTRKVRLAWRQGDFCGVSFLDAAPSGAEAPPDMSDETEEQLRARIRELEGMVTKLNARIQELTSG
ncbi:MAG: PilZ domain [Saliniramus fredricksonii]|uniref:PilZ domain n=2 Tax=Saliniramus fredricksonii TaxID=1653334 RepID=A0A0P7YDK3_9HYPH|nr:MAG: PilZ domain [Saliniramus fredricksonii]SCC81316.1 PilZ domain-containing protein [Saliniramus fredricksonii]